MGRKRRTAGWAIRHHLKALVKKFFLPYLFKSPPLGLDIIIVIGDIGIIHICPESYLVGEFLPHAFIFPDRFLALCNKGFKAVFFYAFLPLYADFLFHLKFNRQTVSIPAGLSRNLFALHCMITRNKILYNTGLHMAYMRLTVSSRRSVIKHICGAAFSLLHALFENVICPPEISYLLLSFGKIKICVNFLIHVFTPCAQIR